MANALDDDDLDVCRKAAVSLFTFGAKARIVIPSIITALQHADPTIRRAAAATLSLIGPEARAALPILRELEQDPDELLRVWVHAALKAIGEEQQHQREAEQMNAITERIVAALQSRPDGMRWQEIRAMFDVNYSDEQIRQALLQAPSQAFLCSVFAPDRLVNPPRRDPA